MVERKCWLTSVGTKHFPSQQLQFKPTLLAMNFSCTPERPAKVIFGFCIKALSLWIKHVDIFDESGDPNTHAKSGKKSTKTGQTYIFSGYRNKKRFIYRLEMSLNIYFLCKRNCNMFVLEKSFILRS